MAGLKNRIQTDFISTLLSKLRVGKILRYSVNHNLGDFNDDDIPNLRAVKSVAAGSVAPLDIPIASGSDRPFIYAIPSGYNYNRLLPKVLTGSGIYAVSWGIVTIDTTNNQIIIDTGDDGTNHQIDNAVVTLF